MQFTIRLIRGFLVCITIGLAVYPAKSQAQQISEDEIVSLSGWTTTLWSDAVPGSGIPDQEILSITDSSGGTTRLEIDPAIIEQVGGLFSLDRTFVTVDGINSAPLGAADQSDTLSVQSIKPATAPEDIMGARSANGISGSQPWLTILCKFSDVSAEPNPPSFFEDMYGNTYPGLDHYWQEQSYNQINLAGSDVIGWLTLSKPKSSYVYDANGDGNAEINTDLAFDDCTAAADGQVNFPSFVGINLMFNADMASAWGGTTFQTLDGVSKIWYVTWEPPWGYQNLSIIAHEMGHGFGLPHSSGDYGVDYDNQWDVMSDAWTNCTPDVKFGCLGQHTIAYHKNLLNWIKASEILIPSPNSEIDVTLERLALPTGALPKMIRIPIGGSDSHFFTVEVRRKTGYDEQLPGEAVVIHEVNTSWTSPAHVVDIDNDGDTGDGGAMWTAGEAFYDPIDDIRVSIIDVTPTAFELTVAANKSDFVYLAVLQLGP